MGVKLGLKAERCDSPKCAMIRRPYKPGMHGKSRRRKSASEYSQQLLEKQKMKIIYGLKESQLKKIVKEIMKKDCQARELSFFWNAVLITRLLGLDWRHQELLPDN